MSYSHIGTSNESSDPRKPSMQYDSIDFVVSTQRLPIYRSGAQGVYHYGTDNNYPTKVAQIAARSSTLVSVINIQSKFIAGLGFDGATAKDVKNGTALVINRNGYTAYQLLQFCAQQKSNINIAIHVNYNQLGEAAEFTPINYEFVRQKTKTSNKDKYKRFIITNIWHLENAGNYGYNSVIQQFNSWVTDKESNKNFSALEVFDYDPSPAVVREQIEISGGIENYSGQIFYMNRTTDIYQKSLYDSVLDDAQIEAEAKLYSLSNLQNGFSPAGFLKLTTNANGSTEIEELKKKVSSTTGAINAGRVIVVPIQPNTDGNVPGNVFEPMQIKNMDNLFKEQKEEAKRNIQQIFNIPNALLGKDTEGNFATQKMQETFEFYNSVTKPLRQELEIELTNLFKNSVLADNITLPITIEPLKYMSTYKNTQTNDKSN